MKSKDYEVLAMPLPEDVMKEKWSGHFDEARTLIKYHLEQPVDSSLKKRLEIELETLSALEENYIYNQDEALRHIQSRVKDFTETEFKQLLLEGKLDWIYLDGEKKFLDTVASTLIAVYSEIKERSTDIDTNSNQATDAVVNNCVDGEKIKARIHICHKLKIADDKMEKGKNIRVFLPLPVSSEQVQNLNVIRISPKPDAMPSSDHSQPVILFKDEAIPEKWYEVEYSFDHCVDYMDLSKPLQSDNDKFPLTDKEKSFLSEELPHIGFTPYLKALTSEVLGDETDLLKKARRIYDFISTSVQYRFTRYYSCIDNLSEYCAVNKRGDCGIQTLMFITMCRIAGVPAKWQSGLCAEPGGIGPHDWAQFFIPGIGWRFADLSYGCSAYRRGNTKRWNFYFGNMDPFRVPINNGFQCDFAFEKKFSRYDPYDNQWGEIEYDDRGVTGDELEHKYIEIEICQIK